MSASRLILDLFTRVSEEVSAMVQWYWVDKSRWEYYAATGEKRWVEDGAWVWRWVEAA